jgi:hypothetical protein
METIDGRIVFMRLQQVGNGGNCLGCCIHAFAGNGGNCLGFENGTPISRQQTIKGMAG